MITQILHHLRFLGSVALLAVAFLSGPAARAQSQIGLVRAEFVPVNNVSFTISLEKTTFGRHEKISVHYRIKNVTHRPLYVPQGYEATACLNIGGPHIWGWFDNRSGRTFRPGYGASCASRPGDAPAITQRMTSGSVLLQSGGFVDGIFQLDPQMFGGLPAGSYRIEAQLRGWTSSDFTDAELTELSKIGSPFLRGEVSALTDITLAP